MKSILLTAFLTIYTVSAANAQSLSGVVRDTNGHLVAGSQVIARNQTTNIEKAAVSDRQGVFSIGGLRNGSHELTVTASGFLKKTQTIDVGQNATIEITLDVGNVAEIVSVASSYLAGTPESLTRTPGSIQVIGRDELRNSRFFNFDEALKRIAGVSIRNEEGFGLRPNISIRGTNPTRSSKILLLEDGIPLAYAPYGDNASYYHPPIERFESVEVLKGSGQIEYGPVTVAGVINYITPNPTEDQSISLKLEGGNRSFARGNVIYGNTLGDTGVLFNFTRKQGEGSRENVRLGINDLSMKIVQPLNDKNVLTGKFSWLGEDSNLTYSGLTEAEFAVGPRSNPFRNDFFYANRFGTSLSHAAVFSPKVNLTTNFYASNFSRHWWRQSSNSGERPNRLGSDADCRGMQDLNTTCGNQGRLRNYWVVGIEPRLNVQFNLGSVQNDLNIGFRYQYEDQNRRQENGDLPNSRDGVLVEDNERKVNAVSGFIRNSFVYKNFSITPGVRIEKINYSRTNRMANGGLGVTGETDLTEVIPGIGLAYNFLGNTTVFVGVHRGFAPPAASDILTNNGGTVELDAERSWNYEVGIRTRPIDGISLEGTFFRNDFENQVVSQSVAGGIGSALTNGGETLQQGFELFARADSSRIFKTDYNIYFQAAYTLLETAEFRGTRYSSLSGFTNVPVSGNRLPYTPKNSLTSSVGLGYRGFDGFFETSYIDGQFSDDLNRINSIANGQAGFIPSQIYFNATGNYRVEKLRSTFFVTVKNIADRTFVVDRSRGILPSSPRLIQGGVQINL